MYSNIGDRFPLIAATLLILVAKTGDTRLHQFTSVQ